MAEKRWQWLLLLALMGVAPFLYAMIQGYWALLLVPAGQFLSVTGKVPYVFLIVIMNFVGALIVAALLSLPLGYAANERPFIFGALLSAAPLAFLFWAVEDGSNVTTFLRFTRTAEYLSIVVAFVVLAEFGAYLKKRRTT